MFLRFSDRLSFAFPLRCWFLFAREIPGAVFPGYVVKFVYWEFGINLMINLSR